MSACAPCAMAQSGGIWPYAPAPTPVGLPYPEAAGHYEELPLRGQIIGDGFWPDPSKAWEHLHTNIRPGYWGVPLVNIKWGSYTFEVPAPADRLITDDNIAMLWDQVFERFGQGTLLLVALWARADRVAGIPYLWHYHCDVIYQDVPGTQVYAAAVLPAFGTLLAGFAEIMLVVLALAITLRLVGTGDLKELAQAPFQGIAVVVVLGIVLMGVVGFVFPQLQARTTARLGPVGVEAGRAPSRARRR